MAYSKESYCHKIKHQLDPSANRVCVGLLGGGVNWPCCWLGVGKESTLSGDSVGTALVLGFLIIEMEKRMGSFLLQMYLGWPHRPTAAYESCFSQPAPLFPGAAAERQGFSRPVFPFLQKQRFCLACYAFVSTQPLMRAVNTVWLMFPEYKERWAISL